MPAWWPISAFIVFLEFLPDLVERKIRCGRITPAFLQCIRTDRACQSYGLRLSWPRPSDRRRAMVASHLHIKLPDLEDTSMDARLVHTYASDVALHHQLSAPLPAQHVPMTFGGPMLRGVTTDDRELLQYCKFHRMDLLLSFFYVLTLLYPVKRHASRSLPLLGDDPSQAGTPLIHMALTGNTLLKGRAIRPPSRVLTAQKWQPRTSPQLQDLRIEQASPRLPHQI